MKLLLLALFFATVLLKGRSQNYIPYYNLRNEAVHQYLNNNYIVADSLLSEAFKQIEPQGKDFYLASVIKVKLKQKENAIRFLKLSFSQDQGLTSPLTVQHDSLLFLSILEKKQFYNLLDSLFITFKFDSFKIKESPFNKNMNEIVQSFIDRDQMYRSYLKEKISLGDSEKRDIEDCQLHKDLMEFVSNYGWPTGVSELLTTVLIHFNEEEYFKYKDILFTQVKLGRLDPYWYARMEDRIQVFQNSNFCSYGIWNKDCPEKIVRVNRLRIGLSPYWDGPYRIFTKMISK